ncbi:MAG: energy-converting hydrogenase B subunit J [Methanosphaera stadtmanae]|jgi:energy-converting hydrogenase B subunit J|nr:energy-converting hydrogenase B subunit J [Methanosphaera stadtmanae]
MVLDTIAPQLFGMLYTGPVIFGFIIGFLVGVIMHKTPTNGIKLNTSSWIAIIIGGIIVAWWLGTFPYYEGLQLAPGFVVAIIGAIIGRGLLGTKSNA